MRKFGSIRYVQLPHWPVGRRLTTNAKPAVWREQLLILTAYFLLSVALTWPLVQNFSTSLTGTGDVKHLLWTLWHTKEAVLGHEPLFSTSLLYYPVGITLFVQALGPLLGIVALPFWTWGPIAASNGVVLIGFWLSGYCMYLLARDLKFERGVALFAGVLYLVAPIHLSALFGHITKAFIGLIPLALLALHRALDVNRSRWWTVIVGLIMFLCVLHSGEQFIFAGMAMLFFTLAIWIGADRGLRKEIAWRACLIAFSVLILTGPLLIAISRASSDPNINVARNLEALRDQPDLAQFFLPPEFSRLLHSLSAVRLLGQPITVPIETAVYLSWTGLFLCGLALIRGRKLARRWLVFTLLSVVIALGPTLQVLGETTFTDFKIPIVLPYAFITSLPGLDFWRTPGRFMLVGFVGFGIAAAFGLTWLLSKLPDRLRNWAIVIATILVLAEVWPYPWPQEKLPPVPVFYQRLALDPEQYGVFDLPIRPSRSMTFESWHLYYSSNYQMYQMTHGKGIAAGYVDRPYTIDPLFGHFVSDSVVDSPWYKDILINGRPSNRYSNALLELARNRYRYVVFHKPQADDPAYPPGSWGEKQAKAFIAEVFGSQPPIVDDNLTTVYEIPPVTDVSDYTTTLALRESNDNNWAESQLKMRWAISPATFYLASPRAEPAYLEIKPRAIHDPRSNRMLNEAVVTLDTGLGPTSSTRLAVGKKAILPLMISPGSHIITMTTRLTSTLAPTMEASLVDFAIESIGLRTWGHFVTPPDIFMDGLPQSSQSIASMYGAGWYAPEQDAGQMWRWARSPARLYVYSAGSRPIDLILTPALLHEPTSPNRLGTQGTLAITANDQTLRIPVRVEQPATIPLELQDGWNTIDFELATGNFDSADAGEPDHRQLSFALHQIDLRTRQ